MFSSFSVAIGEAVCSLVKDTIATLHDVVRALSHKRRYGRYLRQCRSGNNGEESLFLGSDTASSQYFRRIQTRVRASCTCQWRSSKGFLCTRQRARCYYSAIPDRGHTG